MIDTSGFRRGLRIEMNGEPFLMVEFQHVKPGKGGAFVRTKLKSLISGNVLEKTFRSGEKVDTPDLEEKEMQYTYQDADGRHFMDLETYEDVLMTDDSIGDACNFLSDGLTINVLYHNGSPIAVELPIFVELTITETDPGVKGDTASGGSKPAVLETGASVQVPLFLSEGEMIKIDTRTGEYVERVK